MFFRKFNRVLNPPLAWYFTKSVLTLVEYSALAKKAEEVIKLYENKSNDSLIEYVSSLITSVVKEEFIGIWN